MIIDNLLDLKKYLFCDQWWAGFFFIATINLSSLKRIKDSDLKKNCNYEKREINTFKKFHLQSFSLGDVPVPCTRGTHYNYTWLPIIYSKDYTRVTLYP